MIRRAALLAVCGLLAGCAGGGESADEVLSETAANLGDIRSGTLHVDLRVEPRGPTGAKPFGFALDGPFALGGSTPLLVADIEYTQTSGDETATVTLISTGSKAYIRDEDRTYELPPEQSDQLRGAAGQLRAGAGLGEFAIDEWIEDAEVDDGGDVGGAATDHVQAELDVVAAVRDLSALARQLGVSVQTVSLSYQEAERRGYLRGEVGRGTFVRSRVTEKSVAIQQDLRAGYYNVNEHADGDDNGEDEDGVESDVNGSRRT